MNVHPSERAVRVELPQGWGGDAARAAAALRAAGHLVCQHLLPVAGGTQGMPHFAAALAPGVPGIIELDSLLPLGCASVTVRAPDTAESAARRVAEQIRDMATQLAPVADGNPGTVVEDDLPF